MNALTKTQISDILKLNKKLYFKREKPPYRLMAISDNYAIVARKLNRRQDAELLYYRVEMRAYMSFTEAYEDLKDSPVYSILDLNNQVKGTDNMIFGIYNYFDSTDCELAIKDLESKEMQLSHRNTCSLNLDLERTILK